jgi:hypothetical protein
MRKTPFFLLDAGSWRRLHRSLWFRIAQGGGTGVNISRFCNQEFQSIPERFFTGFNTPNFRCVWGNRSDQVAQFQYDNLNHGRNMVKILEIPEAGSMVHE